MPRFILLCFCLFLAFSCSQNKNERPGTSMETGRTFIRASLDGDFKTAKELVFQDSTNLDMFAAFEQLYRRLPQEKKENYKKASFEINKFTEPDDSTAIINYSNSFMHKPMEIKIIRVDKQWWIDFKYTGSSNSSNIQ